MSRFLDLINGPEDSTPTVEITSTSIPAPNAKVEIEIPKAEQKNPLPKKISR